MKIKFTSDDELPLNKMIEIPSMIIVVRAVFQENNKHYAQAFLDECLRKLKIIQKCYILIELTILKELMLIKKSASKECHVCHCWYFLNFSFKFQPNVIIIVIIIIIY